MPERPRNTTSHFSPALIALAVCAGALAGLARRSRSSFKGRTVVITGGSRGLGLALARLFAAEGARLALLARSPDQLTAARRELAARGADGRRPVRDPRSRRRGCAINESRCSSAQSTCW
jgi:D-arabinose 1-dehydrogenase-like Zn-dependent alcohol dehydrogenase